MRHQPYVNRRTVLQAAGVAAAAGLATTAPASAASAAPASPAARVPRTLASPVSSAAGRTVRADFPIEYVGVSWNGPRRGAGIRLLGQDGSRGEWTTLQPMCAGGADGDPATRVGVLVPAGGAAGYEIRLPDGADDLRATAVDTVNGPTAAASSDPATRSIEGVEYITRAGWGADESLRFKADGSENSPPTYYPAQTLTVHHTAGVNGDPDPAATIRAYYYQHAITNDWGDIGYHFLIDEAGRIYEGRYSGDDGLPAHDTTGKMVTAFHAAGYNSGNLGIALLGTFSDQSTATAARDSLTLLLATLSAVHGFDPQADVTFVNPVNGVTRNVPMISGHRDWLATECPGTTLYGELPALRADVAAVFSG